MGMAGSPDQPTGLDVWEQLWAPYDETTYQAVLDVVEPQDCVLEIGAGDLRLAWRLAQLTRHVYAIELQPELLPSELTTRLPENLSILVGDARSLLYPPGLTVAVLLMRHCTHFQLYATRLRQASCRRLITNARWRMSVEVIDLQTTRQPFQEFAFGWYACWCGATGFKPGPPEDLTPEIEAWTWEVADCPACWQKSEPQSGRPIQTFERDHEQDIDRKID